MDSLSGLELIAVFIIVPVVGIPMGLMIVKIIEFVRGKILGIRAVRSFRNVISKKYEWPGASNL